MKSTLSFIAGVVFALVHVSCSAERASENRLSQEVRTVEVGNPEDSRPGKPNQPKPLSLVQVDLLAGDLEEIAQVRLFLEAANLIVLANGRKEPLVASSDLKAGAQLLLAPQSTQSMSFLVPGELLESRAELKVEMKFVAEKPGTVKANDIDYEISPQTAPLVVPLTGAQESRSSEQKLLISKIIDKSGLFNTDAGRVRGTSMPASTTVIGSYRLKGSQ